MENCSRAFNPVRDAGRTILFCHRARALVCVCVYTQPSALFLSNDRFAFHRDPLRIPCESSLRVPTKKKLRASTEKSSRRHRRRRGLDRVRAMSRLTTTSKKMASSVADHDIYHTFYALPSEVKDQRTS